MNVALALPSRTKVVGACLKSIIGNRPASSGNTVVKQQGNLIEVLHNGTQELAIFWDLNNGNYMLIVEDAEISFDGDQFELCLETMEQILNA